MAIDPTKSGGIPAYENARAAQQNAAARAAREVEKDGSGEETRRAAAALAAGDQVRLSADARGLVDQVQAPAPVERGSATGLSAEKLKTVLERMQSGFYDRAEVRDATALGISKDLSTE
jgi:hypothetical protein